MSLVFFVAIEPRTVLPGVRPRLGIRGRLRRGARIAAVGLRLGQRETAEDDALAATVEEPSDNLVVMAACIDGTTGFLFGVSLTRNLGQGEGSAERFDARLESFASDPDGMQLAVRESV